MSEVWAALKKSLPALRGRVRQNVALAKLNWFQVGGPAELLFKPEDVEDLAYFLANRPKETNVTVLGVGSNLLVRDGGIEGVVIRLGRGLAGCIVTDDVLHVGAGCLNSSATAAARDAGLGGLEFLSGIPGSIGGALAMNAGAYGTETKDVLVEVKALDENGNTHTLQPADLNYGYRQCSLPAGWVFTAATLRGRKEEAPIIAARMQEIAHEREETQPVRSRTGGSTFKNPPGDKAWRLIADAGCRALSVGAARMSEKHCNFMINAGCATAADLETLGDEVRRRVRDHCGVALEWEIRRIGKPLSSSTQRVVA